MKVVLKTDVKDLGKAGEIVNVKNGYARNFLFPRKLATEASEKNEKQMAHINKLAEIKMKKAIDARKELLSKVEGLTVNFKETASETGKLFGSVTTYDVSLELDKMGFPIDKRDIQFEVAKMVGQHKATVSYGEGMTAEFTVSIETKQ